MVSEAALLLAQRRDELPALARPDLAGDAAPGGGVLTPAVALGDVMIEALIARGVAFRGEHGERGLAECSDAFSGLLRDDAAEPPERDRAAFRDDDCAS